MYVKLVIRCLVFAVAVLSIASGLAFMSNLLPMRYHYPTGSTNSSLLVLEENHHYDLLFLGASHAFSFLKEGNYPLVSEQLDKDIAMVAHGAGAGIVPMSVMADYFFTKGSTCEKAVYFIDSQSFFMRELNEEHGFLQSEPLNLLLLKLAIKHDMDNSTLATYFQSKFRPEWWQTKPAEQTLITDSLTKIDEKAVGLRIKNMFPDSLEADMAAHYRGKLDALIETFKRNNCKVLFIVPPTLLGKLPGDDYLLALLEEYKLKQDIAYIDLSNAITDPTLYYDHDHLNTKGVLHMLSLYLEPALEAN